MIKNLSLPDLWGFVHGFGYWLNIDINDIENLFIPNLWDY